MSSYTLICIAFLLVYSSSIVESTLAARSEPTSASDTIIRPQSEFIRPRTPRTSNVNKAALDQSKDEVSSSPYPYYFPYSGPGYPYYGQQPYLPNYRPFPSVYPNTGPYSYPQPFFNPLIPYGPYPPGSTVVGPPSRVSANARP